MFVEDSGQRIVVLDVAGQNIRTAQPPIPRWADADDLPRVFAAKVIHRIVPGDAGDSGDQQWQANLWQVVQSADHDLKECDARAVTS